jgi:hypothetical protein
MKVKELIEELNKLDENREVIIGIDYQSGQQYFGIDEICPTELREPLSTENKEYYIIFPLSKEVEL